MSKKSLAGSLMAAIAALLSAYMTVVVYLVTSMHSMDGDPASGPMNGWGLTVVGALVGLGLGWLTVRLFRGGRQRVQHC